jgi:hypothetical protein
LRCGKYFYAKLTKFLGYSVSKRKILNRYKIQKLDTNCKKGDKYEERKKKRKGEGEGRKGNSVG